MINNEWDKILKEEYNKNYFKELKCFIDNEYCTKTCFPSHDDIFMALKLTDYQDIKVVILGQDPYHGLNEAHGLSFSVFNDIKRPPSLRNIFKEMEDDLGIKRTNNNLNDLAKQGVLLLNSILTVVKDQPLSHKGIGWEIFTDNIIKKISERKEPVVFILWGNYAKSKKELISNHHHILESSHPSPFSARKSFFGSKPFSKSNDYLKRINKEPINWG